LSNPLSYYDPYGLWGLGDPLPQSVLDYTTGIADSLSLGIGPLARRFLEIDGDVDPCSKAYRYGELSSFAFGTGRLLYAGTARLLPQLVRTGGTELERALTISMARNNLKTVARAGSFPNARVYTVEEIVRKYRGDPAEIIKAAQRTNTGVNAVGADAAARAAITRAASCDCRQ